MTLSSRLPKRMYGSDIQSYQQETNIYNVRSGIKLPSLSSQVLNGSSIQNANSQSLGAIKPRGLVMDEQALKSINELNINTAQKGQNPYIEDKSQNYDSERKHNLKKKQSQSMKKYLKNIREII